MCGCRGGSATQENTGQNMQQFEVRLPSGESFTVNSEHEARVAITRAGGGDFSRK
jgi:hypothetical protein